MSNPYRNTPGIRYFQVPEAVSERLTYISHAQLKLLCFVLSEAQRKSKTSVQLPGEVIAKATGIHPTCLGEARKNLVSMALLSAKKTGQTWTYTVADPRDGTPVLTGTETPMPIDFDRLSRRVLELYFRPILRKCRPTQNGLTGCCPFPTHKDDTASFDVSLAENSGGVWQCHGCGRKGKLMNFEVCLAETADGVTIDTKTAHSRVMARLHSLGVRESTTGQYDVVYEYLDEFGEVDSETVRLGADKSKTSRRRPHPEHSHLRLPNARGCKRILYRLPEVMEADTVVVCEGEPDADALMSLRLVDDTGRWIAATTCPYGAGKWRQEYTEQLRGKTVILIGHNDEDGKGIRHMVAVANALNGTATQVMQRMLPASAKDVDEYLREHSGDDFIGLVGGDLLESAPTI